MAGASAIGARLRSPRVSHGGGGHRCGSRWRRHRCQDPDAQDQPHQSDVCRIHRRGRAVSGQQGGAAGYRDRFDERDCQQARPRRGGLHRARRSGPAGRRRCGHLLAIDRHRSPYRTDQALHRRPEIHRRRVHQAEVHQDPDQCQRNILCHRQSRRRHPRDPNRARTRSRRRACRPSTTACPRPAIR